MSPQAPSPEDTKVQRRDLVVLEGPPLSRPEVRWADAAGAHVFQVTERTIVGSAPKAGIVIVEPTVSRLHAELEPRGEGLWVRDLGSRNGTSIEGIPVSGGLVPDGGKIRLGGAELRVHYSGEAASPELWPDDHFGPLLGASTPMRSLFARLSRIAQTDSPALIQGETGTGKELVAQAIHDASSRAPKPFIIVDCAALPETLMESELFGHAQGAFTGATKARVGAIEAADGGTVFLDEIGELPFSLQPRLLRVLETRTIRRLGETSRRAVDVRFISATHRDLRTMVNVGGFREDLFFRLAVLPVNVPPLRERMGDIPMLVQRFLPRGVVPDSDVLRQLGRLPWMGNVRELRNFVDRASAMGTKEALSMNLPSAAPAVPPAAGGTSAASVATEAVLAGEFKEFRERWVEIGEREYVSRLLARHNRNVAAAANEANVTRTYIYRLIRKHML